MMRWFVATVFFSFVSLVSLVPLDSSEFGVTPTDKKTNCTCGWTNKDKKRIVGGTEASEHEYPMIAGIVYKATEILFCGGTLVTHRHIVTAAHCSIDFVEKPHLIGIHVGHNNFHKVKKHTTLKDVEKVILNERYDKKNVKFDIAIMLLKDTLPADPKVGPACLPSNRIPLVGKQARVLGWGLTAQKGSTSDVLLKVDVDFKPFEDCMFSNIYMEIFSKHQVCSFTPNKDSCSGDSGGPLLWRDPETNRYTLVAATSYGAYCGRTPSVNTEIGYFLPWIQKVISETDPTMQTCSNV